MTFGLVDAQRIGYWRGNGGTRILNSQAPRLMMFGGRHGNLMFPRRKGSTGVVIRDHAGTLCGAQAKWHENCADAPTMDAIACKEGLEFARQCGVQRVHLETDCLEFVQLWKLDGMQWSMIMPVMQEVKDLSHSFQEFVISYVGRKCNRVAHEFARQVFGTSMFGVWLHESPTTLPELLEQECNHIT
ncbi:hypothetical protein C2845_PM17G04900 [Panicum miliaceum]|uniref:RNase H type-1 domain-containing protein n=1 Tax=Panicum miliaceum TaxID=4540 RepID=A0A3L6Q458_PANMI|nr:hypothetical protein C2845_PM17G04900 [Panicum miliaceum]